MSEVHAFDWWLERIELARWESEAPGSRSFFGACPAHGGSDSFHVTEKNGKGQVHCFGCSAPYSEILDALDTETKEDGRAPQGTQPSSGVVVVRRANSAAPATSPLAWCAQRCGMTLARLSELIDDGLPLDEDGTDLVFDFDGRATKRRGVGEEKRKAISWAPGLNPPFWPVPLHPGKEITITEGEFDAIVLINAGYTAYSITGGASSPPDLAAFKALKEMGVERIRVLFDEDEAGRKGRETVTQRVREAGIIVTSGRVVGLEPLFDEKDARDVAVRLSRPVVVEDAIDEDGAIPLSDVPSVPPAELLLNYIHPAEHSILYGDGGTGKGVIVADWCATLIRQDKKILIVDYEMHAQHEWRPRIQKFLEADSGRSLPSEVSRLETHVFIVQPTAPVWDIAAWLHDESLRVGADLIVIDSATYACVPEEAEKSVTALKYSRAIATIRKPVLTIAHVTKSDMNPAAPFGSTYWKNGARVITAVSRTGTDPLDPRLLKNWKSNQRGEFKDQHVDWGWLNDDLPPSGGLTYDDAKPKKALIYQESFDRLSTELGRPPTPAEIEADTDGDVAAATAKVYRGRYRAVPPPKITRVKGTPND